MITKDFRTMRYFAKFTATFHSGRGARNFFIGVLVFGIAIGAFTGVFNNYLVEIHQYTGAQRGLLEFFREMPGLLLVLLLALMHRFTEWRILRIATLIALIGAAGLLFSGSSSLLVICMVVLWSTGEHLMMPVRNSIALHIARPGKQGASLGMFSSMGYLGQVAGGLLVALIFQLVARLLPDGARIISYNIVWGVLVILMLVCFFCSFPKGVGSEIVKRPRLYFRRKYSKFYVLELFHGARKQIFLTFAPFVLVIVYGMTPQQMAILIGCCAAINIFSGTIVGKLIDWLGYRNIMIYDTVILFFVCITYGFADSWFPKNIALWVVIVNYILDAIISTAAMASSIYAREISTSKEELSSTLSTGISVNHLISVLAALLGGVLWDTLGVEVLFIFAAVMGLLNTLFATTLPKPGQKPAH
jgi:MFS family permease